MSRTALLWGFTLILLALPNRETFAAFLAFATYDWIKLGQENQSSRKEPPKQQ